MLAQHTNTPNTHTLSPLTGAWFTVVFLQSSHWKSDAVVWVTCQLEQKVVKKLKGSTGSLYCTRLPFLEYGPPSFKKNSACRIWSHRCRTMLKKTGMFKFLPILENGRDRSAVSYLVRLPSPPLETFWLASLNSAILGWVPSSPVRGFYNHFDGGCLSRHWVFEMLWTKIFCALQVFVRN